MSNVTIRQLNGFLTVAELGSFTRAAERLHVAQPALSQHIRDLEGELGLKLFDRTTRRVELTDAGLEFQDSAVKILEELEAATRKAQGLRDRRHGRVAIAAPPLLAAAVVPPAIASFRTAHPGINVVLADVRTGEIVQQVRSGRVDCALGTFRATEEGVVCTPIARDRLMLFCDTTSEFAGMSSVSWRQLEGKSLVTLTRDSELRLLVEIGHESANITCAPTYEVSNVTTALALVACGQGIAALPTYALAGARGLPVLAKPLLEPTISRDILLMTRAGRSVSPAVTEFAHYLKKYVLELMPKDTFERVKNVAKNPKQSFIKNRRLRL